MPKQHETFGPEETEARFMKIVRGALHTPPIPHGKIPKTRKPQKRKRVKKKAA